MNSRKVTVIMGIYNCEDTLEDAVKSIQKQTYTNWELIMCDDGSSDHTYQLAKDMAASDERLIVIRNKKNRGLNYTLNHCLKKATGDYIARMDGDDECSPVRFEKQVFVLENQSEYDIVSSGMYFYDETGVWGSHCTKQYPEPKDIVIANPIYHAPVMMRKECMDAVHGYTVDKRMLRVEDVNLWIKLYAKGYRCCNIQEALYGMRNDRNASNRRKYIYRINEVYVRWLGCKEFNLGIKYYIRCLKPLIAGLIPSGIRLYIRKRQWATEND